MGNFWDSIVAWVEATKVIEQVKEVDAAGLFSNPWFMVPFVALVIYMVVKQAFKDIAIISIFIGVWWATGTEYMKTLTVDGQIQAAKVLPVVGVGAVALAIVIYLIFGRSD